MTQQPRSVSDILNSPAMVNKIKAQVHEFVATQDAEIARRVACIRQLQAEAERIEDAIRAEKAALRTSLEARGESWSDDNGYARLMADSVRTSYDAKALDELSLSSKWWHARLNKFRRSFPVKGGIQVK